MIISSGLSLVLALSASVQVSDGVSRAQGAFTTCLNQFSTTARADRKTVEEFGTALAQQCTQQERAYHDAMVRRDTASRIGRADAEATAKEEIDYARQQARETYELSVTPRSPR